MMADTPTADPKLGWVYDPNDPANAPAEGAPPPDVWVEGDHPTDNPDGVTNSNHDYTPKTQEEKAALLGVEMVEPVVDVAMNEPYPEGSPPPPDEARQAVLDQAHTKQEQVEEANRIRQDVENLRAGGLKAGGAPVA